MICAILCPRRCHTIGIANATRVLLHQLGPQLPNTTRFSLPMSPNSAKDTQNQTQRLGMIRDQSIAKVIKHLTPGARTTDAPRSTAIQRFLQCPSSAELLPERNEETKAGNQTIQLWDQAFQSLRRPTLIIMNLGYFTIQAYPAAESPNNFNCL